MKKLKLSYICGLAIATALLLGACSQEQNSPLAPEYEQYIGSGNLALEGELTLDLGEAARNLSWDVVESQGTTGVAYNQSGAFRLKLTVGDELDIWTIVRSLSQTQPLYVGQLKWVVVSNTNTNLTSPAKYKLRLKPQIIRVSDEAALAGNDLSVSGLLFGKSGAAGQTFSFDPTTLRLSITTPERASDHKDYLKSAHAQQQGIEQVPAVYTFDKLKVSVSKTNAGAPAPYRGIVSPGVMSPRGSVLRLISYVDTDYNLLTAKTKILEQGEPWIGVYSRYSDGRTEAEKAQKLQQLQTYRQALLDEAKRITQNRAYLEPIGGALRGVKDGYFDFSADGIPFVVTKTHDIEIPTIEPRGTRYNTLDYPSAAVAAANAQQGVLNLWVASEEGSTTSAEFALETDFITYLKADKEFDDVGTDPAWPGTKGCYWTETRLISEIQASPGNPSTIDTYTSSTVGSWGKTPRRVLALGLWQDVKTMLDAKYPASGSDKTGLRNCDFYFVRNGKLSWESIPHPLPAPEWKVPTALEFIAYLPRYDEPTKQTRRQTITLGKGRSYAGRLIYTVYAGGYAGRFQIEPTPMLGVTGFGYSIGWDDLPE